MAQFPGWTNPAAASRFPTAVKGAGAYASLIEYAPAPGSTVQAWPFLVNPEEISTGFGAEWASQPTFASRYSNQHFSHNTDRTWTLSGVKLRGWLAGVSLDTAIADLEMLTVADIPAGRYSPPSLAFVWGDRSISPVVLQSVSVTEMAWRSGHASDADLTLTLLKLPPPETIPDATAPDAQPVRLTARQQNDGIKQALAWLTENVGRLPAELAESVRLESIALAIDPATGNITTAAGDDIGLWDGREFTPTVELTEQQTTA